MKQPQRPPDLAVWFDPATFTMAFGITKGSPLEKIDGALCAARMLVDEFESQKKMLAIQKAQQQAQQQAQEVQVAAMSQAQAAQQIHKRIINGRG